VGEGWGGGSLVARAFVTPLPTSVSEPTLVGLPHKGGGNMETREQQASAAAP
jgi:hypothetical protein